MHQGIDEDWKNVKDFEDLLQATLGTIKIGATSRILPHLYNAIIPTSESFNS